ncbi:MAG: hypothetical protein K0U41_04515 [Gammaproteobacteria bacterium]|nr:hypothetical protein [Gammaproteobacteria bacterium]
MPRIGLCYFHHLCPHSLAGSREMSVLLNSHQSFSGTKKVTFFSLYCEKRWEGGEFYRNRYPAWFLADDTFNAFVPFSPPSMASQVFSSQSNVSQGTETVEAFFAAN